MCRQKTKRTERDIQEILTNETQVKYMRNKYKEKYSK